MTKNFDGKYNVSAYSATKFVETSNVAVNQTSSYSRRLSQRLDFVQNRISVGWVAIYLASLKSDSDAQFTMHMEVRGCNSDNSPDTTVYGSSTLTSPSIVGRNWYRFTLGIAEMDTPENGLCIVVWQSGGDENNYASWGYAIGDYTSAMTSADGTTWTVQPGAHRLVRSAAAFDAYKYIVDPTQKTNQISTPAAIESSGVQNTVDDLSGGAFVNTYLDTLPPLYPYYPAPALPVVKLDSQDMHVTFVVDSSGSMGWNDRFAMRKEVAETFIQRMTSTYPKGVTYDFIHFGGRQLDVIDISQNQRVRGVFVDVDDYSNFSGFDSDGVALVPGDIRSHLGTGVVAYGYKDLKAGTTYVSAGMDLGWTAIEYPTVAQQWHDIWPTGNPALTTAANGPNGDDALNIVVSDATKDVTRYAYGNGPATKRTNLVSDMAAASTIALVTDAADLEVNQLVNIVDVDGIRPSRALSAVDVVLDKLTLVAPVYQEYDVTSGAFVENAMAQYLSTGWAETNGFEIFLLDAAQKGDVKLYVQTANGAQIEWTFTPLAAWELMNLYFLDETAVFDVDAVDSNDVPLPDGTVVEFYVDKEPLKELETAEENAQKDILLTQDADSGAISIYVSTDNISKVKRGDTLDIIDEDRNPEGLADTGTKTYHTSVISSVVTSSGKIIITDAMPSDYLMSKEASILVPSTDTQDGFDVNLTEKLPIIANLVDISPIYAGESIPSEYYNDLDPPPVDPTANPDDYNDDPTRVRRQTIEVLIKNGYGAVRLSPITEDKFPTPEVRDALARDMFSLSERDQVRLLAIDDMENGVLKVGVDDATTDDDVSVAETEAAPVYYDGVPDFTMNHKVVVFDGFTSSDMKSFATDLVEVSLGTSNPRSYLARTYSINPIMTMYDASGDETAIILMNPYDVYFASPIFITNTVDSTVTYYQCPYDDPDIETIDITVTGAYATDTDPISIEYDVTDKDFPADGLLTINIYDGRRTISTRMASDDDIGELNGCNDTESLLGGAKIFSTSASDDEYEASLTDKIFADDLLGEDYASSFTVEVVGGTATFTLPTIDRVALLEVHAIFSYNGGTHKVVNKQNIYYKNPVVINLIGAGQITADGETRYNIGASVSWKGLYAVDDGTIVNLEADLSQLTPSTSQTISGVADGVLIGPHEPIPPPTGLAALLDNGGGENEGISAVTTFRGYTSSKSGNVTWMPQEPPSANFYFYATGNNTNTNSVWEGSQKIWSDGYDYIVINGDLPASAFRLFPFIDVVTPDLIESRMGVVYSGSGLTPAVRLPRWSDVPPVEGPYETDTDVPTGWVSNRISSNKFVGRPPYRVPSPDRPNPCDSPECLYVSLFTKSRKYNVVGLGIESDTVSFLTSTISGAEATIPKPRVYPIEPLGITMSMEPISRSEYQDREWQQTPLGESPKSPEYDTYSWPVVRNGENKYFVVAEITWRDDMIVGTVDNPLPEVRFEAGEIEFDAISGQPTFTKLENPSDFPLDSPTANVTHVRTTFDEDHYHEVVVDDNGRGQTTSTIIYVKDATVADHVHTIDILSGGQIVADADAVVNGNGVKHNHSLRSVAIVGCAPMTDKTASIAVKGEVTYDNGKIQSDGTRVSRTLDNYAAMTPDTDTDLIDSGYRLEIIPVGMQYVDGKVVSAFPIKDSGSDAGYTVLFKAYRVLSNGDETPIADGTRVFTNFDFYKFNDDDTGDTTGEENILIITKDDDPVNHAVLRVSAFLSQVPDEVSAETDVMITTENHWFPDVFADPRIRQPSDDPIVIAQILDSFHELGASQLNDAIALAARRMITFEDAIGSDQKIIVAITDASESLSELSFDQALEELAAVDRDNPVEIFVVKLADTTLYDDLVAKKFALDSDGDVLKVSQVDADTSVTASAVVDGLVDSPHFDALSGTYINTVDLGGNKLFDGLSFNVLLPSSNSGVNFRVRFSDNDVTYDSWVNLGSGPDFDIESSGIIKRYMQYEVTFSGDYQTFESPEFYGIEYNYYEPRGYTMFFQPLESEEGKDGYVGEIIFAHHGTIPDTSTVDYGISHGESTLPTDFSSTNQPLMADGTGGIVLSRVNELLVRSDSQNFTAAYGGWSDYYVIEVYRMSVEAPKGSLVNDSAYSYDNLSGAVAFGESQPSADVFTMTLSLKPTFRIMVDMENYGPSTILLDYIGTMYRTVDRSEIYEDDRRPVYTLVDTDLEELGTTSSGIIAVNLSIYNTEIGSDSDSLVDILLEGGIYYVLAWDGTTAYIASMNENLTFIERKDIALTVEPLSLALMDSIWHVTYRDGSRYKVVRFDSDYNVIDTSTFGYRDENDGIIRSRLDRWYVPASTVGNVDIYSRSFAPREAISAVAAIAPTLAVEGESLWSLAAYRDILFEFTLDGAISTSYVLTDRATNVVNIQVIEREIFMVEPNKISRIPLG